jgi:AraC-like DNA-binding protein
LYIAICCHGQNPVGFGRDGKNVAGLRIPRELSAMYNLLQAITAGCAIFLAFLVATVRRDTNAAANRWLAAFLLLVGLFMLDDSLLVYGIYEQHPQLIGLLNMPFFALTPTLFMAVAQFVAVKQRFRKKDIWHFLPFILFFLLSLPFLFSSDEIKLQELETLDEPMNLVNRILLLMLVVQVVSYLFYSFLKLKKHQKNIQNITASPAEVNLDWLLYFLYGVAAMVLVWFFELFLVPYQEGAGWYTPAYLVAIFCLGYFALRQKEVFPFSEKEAAEIGEIFSENDIPAAAARRQIAPPEKLELLKNKLLQKMETEKPHLDPELNLPGLAQKMGLSVHEMSELVNEGFGENFAQFVNRHRIEESKRLLFSEKHAHLSMVGIAFEAGFNSKTAFNMAFKKMTGVSPTDFKNGNKKPFQ